jgi:antitoxin component of MazEF toxin-antitoxin module
MLRTISKIGKSQGIIFDNALMELAHLRTGDEVNLEVHAGGTITITPLRKEPSADEVSKTIKKTMKRLRSHNEAPGMREVAQSRMLLF